MKGNPQTLLEKHRPRKVIRKHVNQYFSYSIVLVLESEILRFCFYLKLHRVNISPPLHLLLLLVGSLYSKGISDSIGNLHRAPNLPRNLKIGNLTISTNLSQSQTVTLFLVDARESRKQIIIC